MEEYHLLSSLRPDETLEILYGSEGRVVTPENLTGGFLIAKQILGR